MCLQVFGWHSEFNGTLFSPFTLWRTLYIRNMPNTQKPRARAWQLLHWASDWTYPYRELEYSRQCQITLKLMCKIYQPSLLGACGTRIRHWFVICKEGFPRWESINFLFVSRVASLDPSCTFRFFLFLILCTATLIRLARSRGCELSMHKVTPEYHLEYGEGCSHFACVFLTNIEKFLLLGTMSRFRCVFERPAQLLQLQNVEYSFVSRGKRLTRGPHASGVLGVISATTKPHRCVKHLRQLLDVNRPIPSSTFKSVSPCRCRDIHEFR